MTNRMVPCGATFMGTTPGGHAIARTCGNHAYGTMVLCDECEEASDKQFPQGWRGYPGDVCKHGVYVGGCGVDHMCPRCEDGDDSEDDERRTTPWPWYYSGTGNDQALVISERTGANVAVVYDKRDANLIAAAPMMLSALEDARDELSAWVRSSEQASKDPDTARVLRVVEDAIAATEEVPS